MTRYMTIKNMVTLFLSPYSPTITSVRIFISITQKNISRGMSQDSIYKQQFGRIIVYIPQKKKILKFKNNH